MSKVRKSSPATKKKIFVLDTSVILYDHNAFNNFQEHDVAIPIQVLEELDNMKNGNETRNAEARSFIRVMDNASGDQIMNVWMPIKGSKGGRFKVVMDQPGGKVDAEVVFGAGKFDHRILNAALGLKEEFPKKKVILVSKDICLRLKAKSLDLNAEDYETGKIKNVEELYTGKTTLNKVPEHVFAALKESGSIDARNLNLPFTAGNHFYTLKSGKKNALAYFDVKKHSLYRIDKHSMFKIQPKNEEQALAM
uniref:PIN domain-containing protein n=1 Tax=Pedobacter sp. TaxID=1411316 RepID=UPI003D7F7A82